MSDSKPWERAAAELLPLYGGADSEVAPVIERACHEWAAPLVGLLQEWEDATPTNDWDEFEKRVNRALAAYQQKEGDRG